ncbi:hypothetical protein DPSP01_012763 [Paraphaeosphaeria sporulosa]
MVTDLTKTAASVYTGGLSGALGGGFGGGSGGQSSKKGEMINYFDKTQGGSNAAGPSSNAGGGGARGVPVPGSKPSGGNPGRTSSAGDAASTSNSQGFSQNPAARGAVGGETGILHTLMSKVDDVIGMGSENAESLVARKAWPHLDPDTVLGRIKELCDKPWSFDQASFGFCDPAAFYYSILQHHKDDFVSFANALYGGGIGFLGDLKVAPDSDLRNADYAVITAKTPPNRKPPSQAEWMLMCSIRDSENWFIDFEGDEGEVLRQVAARTTVKEMSGWFNRTGWYTTEYKNDPSLTNLKALPTDPDVLALLGIQVQLLKNDYPQMAGDKEGHAIVLRSQIDVNEATDKASFRYWTWGFPELDSKPVTAK